MMKLNLTLAVGYALVFAMARTASAQFRSPRRSEIGRFNAATWMGACMAVVLLVSQAQAAAPVFHLDFDGNFNDKSASAVTTEVGSSVTLSPAGGPVLTGGATLDAATFAGVFDDIGQNEPDSLVQNEIRILSNATFNDFSNDKATIVTWLKPAQSNHWNTIITNSTYGSTSGIELQATSQWAGIFAAMNGGIVQNTGGSSFSAPGCCDFGNFDNIPVGGVWVHIAYTFDMTTGANELFLNGSLVDSNVHPDVPASNDADMGSWSIGGQRREEFTQRAQAQFLDDTSRVLEGDLADFAIFDTVLTQSELDQVVAMGVGSFSVQSADFDNDLDVDGADFLVWQRGGSPNGAGAGDLALWEAQFGTTAVVAAAAGVPEPASWILLVGTIAIAGAGRRRRLPRTE